MVPLSSDDEPLCDAAGVLCHVASRGVMDRRLVPRDLSEAPLERGFSYPGTPRTFIASIRSAHLNGCSGCPEQSEDSSLGRSLLPLPQPPEKLSDSQPGRAEKANPRLRLCFRVPRARLNRCGPKLTHASIDGVLVRSRDPIPGAREALSFLQSERIPFLLLTNGGGKHEEDRAHDLSNILSPLTLSPDILVQSHTPFAELVDQYVDKTVLVVGGDEDRCRLVAERY